MEDIENLQVGPPTLTEVEKKNDPSPVEHTQNVHNVLNVHRRGGSPAAFPARGRSTPWHP